MTDESFMENDKAIKDLQDGTKLTTMYDTVESMLYYSKPCGLKIMWTSPEITHYSFAFPKDSPLLPFFKYTYKKLRQTGTLKRISEKWK